MPRCNSPVDCTVVVNCKIDPCLLSREQSEESQRVCNKAEKSSDASSTRTLFWRALYLSKEGRNLEGRKLEQTRTEIQDFERSPKKGDFNDILQQLNAIKPFQKLLEVLKT